MKRVPKEEWKRRVHGWRTSGQSARAYAAEHGFSAATLSWWSSRIRHEVPEVGMATVLTSAESSSRDDHACCVEVVVGNGRIVRVHEGFAPELLAAVLGALEASS